MIIFRNKLIEMAAILGYSRAEIFPKQTRLVKDSETGKISKGNFINLPYVKTTERRALNNFDPPSQACILNIKG